MKSKENMVLWIKEHKPIQTYVDGYDMGVMTYNDEKKRYEGFGYIGIIDLIKIIENNEDWMEIEPYELH